MMWAANNHKTRASEKPRSWWDLRQGTAKTREKYFPTQGRDKEWVKWGKRKLKCTKMSATCPRE